MATQKSSRSKSSARHSQPTAAAPSWKKPRKRGIILLMVVSLLALFLLIGITYALVASNYQQAAQAAARVNAQGDLPPDEHQNILTQILCGSANLTTMSPHNLLADLYGSGTGSGDFVDGSINSNNNSVAEANNKQTILLVINATGQPIPDYYAGRVITFTNGSANNYSTRVLQYYPNGMDPYGAGSTGYSVAPFGNSPVLVISAITDNTQRRVLPTAGDTFRINGAPFNGTGVGYDPYTSNLDALYMSPAVTSSGDPGAEFGFPFKSLKKPIALLPNAKGYEVGNAVSYQGGTYNQLTPDRYSDQGDEGYDAPDSQNMFMGFVSPHLSDNPNLPTLPSFHRPDLVNYWFSQMSQVLSTEGVTNTFAFIRAPYGADGIPMTADDPENSLGFYAADAPKDYRDQVIRMKRLIILRPLSDDHPNFTGSNLNWDPVGTNAGNRWDVDNDGDGRPDSIWIDPGLPVMTHVNGKRYKRLVAVYIKDLCGLLDLNTHANLVFPNDNNSLSSTPVDTNYSNTFAGQPVGGGNPIYATRGLGYGPAEIVPLPVLGVDTNLVLQRRYQTPLEYYNNQPGQPGITNTNDGLSFYKAIGLYDNHFAPSWGSYSTPPDTRGRGAMGLDYLGQPIWVNAGNSEATDDPYEAQTDASTASLDSPYSVSELERILRFADPGSTALPARLLNATPNTLAQNPKLRQLVTVRSSHLPVPTAQVPREFRGNYGLGGNTKSTTVLDFYAGRLLNGGLPMTAGAPGTPNVRDEIYKQVPFELRQGRRFNINREFGNGQHDATPQDTYGVVDDPSESYIAEPITINGQTFQMDPRNGSNVNNNDDPRQIFARHLYCLAMLLKNPNYNYDLDGDGSSSEGETARVIAQWAVNVVDFRDADSIMTAFEYDVRPFDSNGWSVDGDLTSDEGGLRGVVWGCERPELLLTESLAFHDERTEDLSTDPTGKKTTDAMNPDDDYDQRLRPRGASFIEVYNPWFDRDVPFSGTYREHKAPELYGATGGVELNRLSSADTNGNRSPVWRMVVVSGANHQAKDPDFPRPESLNYHGSDAAEGGGGNPAIGRSVYFSDLSVGSLTIPPTDLTRAFYPSGNIPQAPVLPGRYAVVGSAGIYDNANNTYTSYVGRRQGDDDTTFDGTKTRRIVLTPNANPNTPQFKVMDNLTVGANDFNTADVQSTIVVPLNRPYSFSITEPMGGYTNNNFDPTPVGTDEPVGQYSPPPDAPLDISRGGDWANLARTNSVSTLANYRTVHLQRLANPLLAWNTLTNPYVTIDSSSVDVTPFNGIAANPTQAKGTQNFQTFQRGGRINNQGYANVGDPRPRLLWPIEGIAGPTGASQDEAATGPHFMTRTIQHTLGYLNTGYQPSFTNANFPAGHSEYIGAPSDYRSDGAQNAYTFPWLAFNNRPFTSPLELMQVPVTSSTQLLRKFQTNSGANLYAPTSNLYAAAPFAGPSFRHVMNFFETAANYSPTLAPGNPNLNTPELARIFDYLEVPSPYVYADDYYNPNHFTAASAPWPNPAVYLRPPFNRLSKFRDPGRININTTPIGTDGGGNVLGEVLDSALQNIVSIDGNGVGTNAWRDFMRRLALSRQGYGSTSSEILQYNAAYPSLFSRPFQAADASNLVADQTGQTSPGAPPSLRKQPVESTLLRRDSLYGADPNKPLLASVISQPAQDANRNPYFRYQAMQKLGNTFTSQSNVYAIWLTVGYFEVEDTVVTQARPDGLALGQEIGADTGEIRRTRSFYIVDRSVPVGYIPGRKLNTDNMVLLRRQIE